MDRAAYTLADQARMTRAKNYFAWQARLVLPELGRRVLEIGCGIGNFTERLLNRDYVIALDEEPACIEKLTTRFRHSKNLCAMARDASDSLADLKTLRPDSCVCLNVLEHIENDANTLANMASVLPQDGAIVLIVPAFPALAGPIDRNLGHYRRYTKTSLPTVAKSAGLTITKARYMNVPGFFVWWLNAHVQRREAQSSAQIEIFDKLIVPVTSRLESLIPPPFGQSLFAVLRKT
jgi:2-polyprenyl-3-methyl-5-hydroxy-6-metoxy-1,4-benzoquinol methylase